MKKIIGIIVIIVFSISIFMTTNKPSVNEKYFISGNKIDSLAYIKDSEDKITHFKDIKKPVLIFKYSELNCGVCIDSTINVIRKLKNFKIKIVIIAEYNSKRSLNIFKRINKLDTEIYRTNFTSNVDDFNFPYLYIIDEDMIQKSVYIPKKENLDAFKKYLNYIEKFYAKE